MEPWKVTVVDTGYNTMTGGRIKRIQRYIDHIRVMKEIVGEPLLNIFLFITGANDKLGITIIGI